jgi:leader peptidase (prepilin peptidase)/N-methyltransferase
MDLLAFVVSALAGLALAPRLYAISQRVPVRVGAGDPEEEKRATVPPGAVRLVAPVLLALAAVRWGASWILVPYLFLYAVLLVVSVVDIERHRIPDRVTFPALGISVVLIAVVSVLEGVPEATLRALLGAAVGYGFMLVPFLIHPRGLGYGDVKLARLMGLYLGWIFLDPVASASLVLMALMIGSILGVVLGGTLTVVRRKRAEFPFGPALAAGCVIAIQLSHHLVGAG